MSKACDLLVIGAGPAGMAAAASAAGLGVSTLLVDEQPWPGGQIHRVVEHRSEQAGSASHADWVRGRALAAAFRASGADYLPGTSVWRFDAGGRVYVTDGETASTIVARRVLIAVGAMERAVPLPGWTLPGVMTVGAAQITYKTSAWLPPAETWIAGSGPLVWLYAAQVADAGGRIAGILDTTPARNYLRALPHLAGALGGARYLERGRSLQRRVRAAGFEVVHDVSDVAAQGDGRIERVRYRTRGRWYERSATLLLLHHGVVPNVHATRSLGAQHRWDVLQRCFVLCADEWGNTDVAGYAVAGDCARIVGAEASVLQGRLAALEAARALGVFDAAERDRQAAPVLRELGPHLRARPFIDRLFSPRESLLAPEDDVLVCRCESVSARGVRAAVAAGCVGPNQMKAYTRCGMGPCQGRMCGLAAAELIARERQADIAQVGTFNVRPPLKPISLGELAALVEAASERTGS
ncbi:MAG: FAD-dependent oxidoreductase [Burkholderiales bacterium]|nr:FAD-dependent oxidoreductase [Burkholderiales bacterium]